VFQKLNKPQEHVKHLILCIGFNNRTHDTVKTVNDAISKLLFQAKKKFPNAKIYYASINNPTLTPKEAKNLKQQEKTWHETHSIPVLSSITNVATNDGIHWTPDTGRLMCDNWLGQINLKN
jgi:hypothetical protein